MSTDESQGISRRNFMATSLATAALVGNGASPAFVLRASTSAPESRIRPREDAVEEKTISQLQAEMASGATSSRALVEAYRARIGERDHDLRAVLELNPDALAIADTLDAERKSGTVRGPLHGIPILLKDNIATADKMQTTAGSLALVDARPPRDAFIAARLRAAGAVILGKTNLSEWANFRSTHA
ncbi:MAG: amidase family protein, partial [Gemmatimonadaceae bacterium]